MKEPLSSCFAPGDRTTAQLLRHNRHSHLIKQPDKVTTGGLSVSNTYTLIACALLQPPLTYGLRITPTPSPPPALSIGRGRGKAVEYNLSPRGGVPIPAYFTPEVWRLFWQHVRYEQHQADMDNSAVTFYSNLRALDEFQRVVFRIIGTENWKCIIFCIFLLCALLTEHGWVDAWYSHTACHTHAPLPPAREQHDFVEYRVAGGCTSAAMVIGFCSYQKQIDCDCFVNVNALLVHRLHVVKSLVVDGNKKLQLLRGYPCYSLSSGASFLPVESIVKKAHMISVFSAELPPPHSGTPKYFYHMKKHFMLPWTWCRCVSHLFFYCCRQLNSSYLVPYLYKL